MKPCLDEYDVYFYGIAKFPSTNKSRKNCFFRKKAESQCFGPAINSWDFRTCGLNRLLLNTCI